MTRQERLSERVLLRKQVIFVLKHLLANSKYDDRPNEELNVDALRDECCKFVMFWHKVYQFANTLETLNLYDGWELEDEKGM